MKNDRKTSFGTFPFGRFCSSFFIQSFLRLLLFLLHLRNPLLFIIIIIISPLFVCAVFLEKYTASYINVCRLCLLGFPYFVAWVYVCAFFRVIVELREMPHRNVIGIIHWNWTHFDMIYFWVCNAYSWKAESAKRDRVCDVGEEWEWEAKMLAITIMLKSPR